MAAMVFDAAEFRRKAQERPAGEDAHKKDEPWIDDDDWGEAELPKRPWVAPGFCLRGSVTVLTGPPSALKSTLLLSWACACALGQNHGRFLPVIDAPVIVYNVEDNRLEQRRRLSATLRQFNATSKDIKGKVIRVGPSGVGTLFVIVEDGRVSPTPMMKKLREMIAERRPAMQQRRRIVDLETALADMQAAALEAALAAPPASPPKRSRTPRRRKLALVATQ